MAGYWFTYCSFVCRREDGWRENWGTGRRNEEWDNGGTEERINGGTEERRNEGRNGGTNGGTEERPEERRNDRRTEDGELEK
jgi:hypothetical protein